MKLTHLTTLSLITIMTATAPALAVINTPGGKEVFKDNDNPAPGVAPGSHPSLTKRSDTARTKTDNAGAWESHQNSNMPAPDS